MSLNSPSLILESSWFKLAAWTWTSTSSSLTSGSGISPRRTALLLLYRSTTNAFMALGHAMGSLSGARLHVALQARVLQPSVPFAPVVDIGNRAVECCGRHVSRHYVLGFPHIATPRGTSGDTAWTSAPALFPNGSRLSCGRLARRRKSSGRARLACRLDKGGHHPRKSIRLVQIHEVPAILELDIPSMGEFLRQRAQTGGNGRGVVFTGDHQCRHSQGLETCEAIAIQPCRHNRSIHLPAVD